MTTYRMDIDGLICDVGADLSDAVAPVYCTLISTIPVDERRAVQIGQTADARHSEDGLREIVRAHLKREGVLVPYPFCRYPRACRGLGSCPRDPSCSE